jgi:transcription antitermination protein NusB
MRSAKDPRHLARVVAVMDLYNFFFGADIAPEAIQSDSEDEDLDIGNYSKKIHETLVNGVKESFTDIDVVINEHSDPVKTADLDNLILQIIRVAVYEAFVLKSVPPKVAVDEAIELTRDFGLELSSKKVSGILGKIFDNLVEKKPEEEVKE